MKEVAVDAAALERQHHQFWNVEGVGGQGTPHIVQQICAHSDAGLYSSLNTVSEMLAEIWLHGQLFLMSAV